MNFVKLLLILNQNYGHYSPNEASNEKMFILGFFLTDDVGCLDERDTGAHFKNWALHSLGRGVSGNITFIEKDDDNDNAILLSDILSDEDYPERLRLSRQQFIKLLNDWQKKVCDLMPKEVIIKHENDEFIIETKD